jgi:hypothetical protein
LAVEGRKINLTAVCRQRSPSGEEGFAMKGDEDGDGDRDRYPVGSGLLCYECVNLIFMVCGCMAVSFFLSVCVGLCTCACAFGSSFPPSLVTNRFSAQN